MRRTVFWEIICVAVLAVFILFITGEEKEVLLSAEEISQSIIAQTDYSELESFGKVRFKEQTTLSPKEFESWVYFGSQDIMNVRELIIIKPGEADSENIMNALEKRLEDKKKIFESYSPEAFSLLDNCILTEKRGVIFFAVGESADKALAVFLECIG